MLERTALISTTFLAELTQEDPHVLILVLILLTVGSQLEDFGAELKTGTPKYLKASHWVFPYIPKILVISNISLGFQFHP